MTRPRGFYAVYQMGFVTHIVRGHLKARAINNRSYKRFTTAEAAEEHAAWWNYESERDRSHLGRAPVIVSDHTTE